MGGNIWWYLKKKKNNSQQIFLKQIFPTNISQQIFLSILLSVEKWMKDENENEC